MVKAEFDGQAKLSGSHVTGDRHAFLRSWTFLIPRTLDNSVPKGLGKLWMLHFFSSALLCLHCPFEVPMDRGP